MNQDTTTGDALAGFVVERDPEGEPIAPIMCSEEFDHHLHVMHGEGKVAIGVSVDDGPIVGIVMTPDELDEHIKALQRYAARVRGGGSA